MGGVAEEIGDFMKFSDKLGEMLEKDTFVQFTPSKVQQMILNAQRSGMEISTPSRTKNDYKPRPSKAKPTHMRNYDLGPTDGGMRKKVEEVDTYFNESWPITKACEKSGISTTTYKDYCGKLDIDPIHKR